jgi:hypothetical protein
MAKQREVITLVEPEARDVSPVPTPHNTVRNGAATEIAVKRLQRQSKRADVFTELRPSSIATSYSAPMPRCPVPRWTR